ncbi:hypothetical protein CN065_14105 [Sinorhizobium meliloti]|uniref:hypothetical protein n=1 Tax=Rhizobium meliloti TaxID=382 RepID=UPI000B4A1C92|nr:hypothetical protein [Sinorhizobium meliloti]ASP98439.1 hypothetical protein CDO24_13960 [Sinorhizobium meliloti]MQV66183.1 hypothetical protein [Sinorhizobium meliloti]RVQ39327.1 hypothetical protein CN065_14105 [Sinorhizobium meliloti]
MPPDEKSAGSMFPGFVILVAIAAMIVTLVSVRQPIRAVRVWVPDAPTGAELLQGDGKAKCTADCGSHGRT